MSVGCPSRLCFGPHLRMREVCDLQLTTFLVLRRGAKRSLEGRLTSVQANNDRRQA
jgi:hypothetical protein